MKTVYSIRHHRGYDCGHAHRSIKAALRCLKRHMFLKKYTCEKCGVERFGFRVSKCKSCGCEELFYMTPYDPDYFVINASDDGGVSWRVLSGSEKHEIAENYHGKKFKKEKG